MKKLKEKATEYVDSLKLDDANLSIEQVKKYAECDFIAGYEKCNTEWRELITPSEILKILEKYIDIHQSEYDAITAEINKLISIRDV